MILPCTENRPVHRSGRWYWLGAIALAVAMIAVGAAPRLLIADGLPGSSGEEPLPADLAWLPADTAAFLSVRVADLWQSPSVKAFRAQLSKEDPEFVTMVEQEFPKTFERFTGVALPEVERLTVALSLRSADPTLFFPMSITTAEPLDRDKVIRTLDGGTTKRESGGETIYQGRGRGVILRFINDRTFLLSMPQRSGKAVPPQEKNAALTDALRQATGKHPIVAGLVPVSLLEQIDEALIRNEPPVMSFVLSGHPLFLAQSGSLTLDLAEITRLDLRLAYRKEATAATGEDALWATLQIVRRWLSRQLATLETESGGFIDPRLLRRLESAVQNLAIEQQGKVVLASLSLKEDLSTALLETTARVRVAAQRIQSQNNLKQLALAMHNYHDTYGRFPPAIVTTKDGKPLYSWRVVLAPYIEADDVFRQFKLDEPWDSPHNQRLLAQMPKAYAAPGVRKDEPFTTHYQVLAGGGAMFELNRPTGIAEITDGLSNTIMIVEAQEAVPWSKPVALTYTPEQPLPKFGGIFKDGFNVAAADGAVHFIPNNTNPDTLRALITRSGGEVVSFPDKGSMRKTTYPPPQRGVKKKAGPPPKSIDLKK